MKVLTMHIGTNYIAFHNKQNNKTLSMYKKDLKNKRRNKGRKIKGNSDGEGQELGSDWW